ncbi:DNA adenine methylase [Oceanidesulfovibrio indonesiensis]|nr:DNA adenine methylase [Oceanidesulfovibrio indonesiensis]
MKSPLAGWMGGKSRLCKEIVSRFPDHTCYCEPFCGGAWTLFRKEPSKVEVLNDINEDVVNLFRVLQNHPEEFLRHFKYVLCSRAEFERETRLPAELLTDIQRAARFYYVQKMCFGGRITSPSFGASAMQPPRLNLLRMEEELSAAHLRLARVLVERLPFDEVIRKYDRPGTVFYVDPPYVGTENVYGKGLFSKDDHARLAEVLKSIQGRFILSQADTPLIRELYNGLPIEPVTVRYSCGKENGTKAKEVLVGNFDPCRSLVLN